MLLLSAFHTTPTSDQMREEVSTTCTVIPNCIGNTTWHVGYPERGLLPTSCVWSKPASFTASWAEASVRSELRPCIYSASEKPISKRSNSDRDIITSVSPDPSLSLKLMAAAQVTKLPSCVPWTHLASKLFLLFSLHTNSFCIFLNHNGKLPIRTLI